MGLSYQGMLKEHFLQLQLDQFKIRLSNHEIYII